MFFTLNAPWRTTRFIIEVALLFLVSTEKRSKHFGRQSVPMFYLPVHRIRRIRWTSWLFHSSLIPHYSVLTIFPCHVLSSFEWGRLKPFHLFITVAVNFRVKQEAVGQQYFVSFPPWVRAMEHGELILGSGNLSLFSKVLNNLCMYITGNFSHIALNNSKLLQYCIK